MLIRGGVFFSTKQASFEATFDISFETGQFVSASATSVGGSTSEISAAE